MSVDFKEFTHTFVEIHGTATVLAQRRSNFSSIKVFN